MVHLRIKAILKSVQTFFPHPTSFQEAAVLLLPRVCSCDGQVPECTYRVRASDTPPTSQFQQGLHDITRYRFRVQLAHRLLRPYLRPLLASSSSSRPSSTLSTCDWFVMTCHRRRSSQKIRGTVKKSVSAIVRHQRKGNSRLTIASG